MSLGGSGVSIGGVRILSEAKYILGVSKNRGTPKWMVKIMEHPIKMDDLGGFHHIFGSTPILD